MLYCPVFKFLGELVSLDCENKLLELTGYYGAQLLGDGGESVSD